MDIVGVTWRNSDLNTLETRLRNLPGVAIDAAEQIVDQTVSEAAELQREMLDRAVTAGGSNRISRGRGNTAGRNDTGQMIGSITHDTVATSKQVSGEWGWLFEQQEYYRFQDFGTNRIPAAHSLLDSFITMREQFIRRLKRITGK